MLSPPPSTLPVNRVVRTNLERSFFCILIPLLKIYTNHSYDRLKFGKVCHSQNQSFTYMSIQTYMFLYLYLFSESILFTSISFKDCSVKKSMETFEIYFYVNFFKANRKFYMIRSRMFYIPFPCCRHTKKTPNFLEVLNCSWWRRTDLNRGHCGYEPHALAN